MRGGTSGILENNKNTEG